MFVVSIITAVGYSPDIQRITPAIIEAAPRLITVTKEGKKKS
jgi:hypothetical protein